MDKKNLNIRTLGNKTPILGQDCFVDSFACVSGDVTLGDQVSVWPFASIRGDLLPIKIGSRTNIQDNAVLHTTHASDFFNGAGLTIGHDVTIGHGAVCHACTLGSRVLIGMNATVLDNSIIQDDVIIGAGALVPPGKTLESGYLYIGSPVKQARKLTQTELDFLKYSAASYIKLAQKHLLNNF